MGPQEMSRDLSFDRFSPDQIQAARVYAAKNCRECAEHAFDDDFGFASHVTLEDKKQYAAEKLQLAQDIESGEKDGCFTVWQNMYYFLTGECVPFLPS